MQEPAAAAAQHKVLDLCIHHMNDAFLLLRVSLVSRDASCCVKAHVQQQLPSLVGHTITAGVQSVDRHNPYNRQIRLSRDYTLAVTQPLQWLLSLAGRAAVNTAAAKAALLRTSPLIPAELQEDLADVAVEQGLLLDMPELVEASKQRVAGLDMWISAANRSSGGSHSSAPEQVLWLDRVCDMGPSGKPVRFLASCSWVTTSSTLVVQSTRDRQYMQGRVIRWSSAIHATCQQSARPNKTESIMSRQPQLRAVKHPCLHTVARIQQQDDVHCHPCILCWAVGRATALSCQLLSKHILSTAATSTFCT
jgi:hypothetical protein